MKYLNTFDTMQDYLDVKDNLTLPSASLIEETKEVVYDKYDPYNGHDYVEIAGKKWATMNIGANSITDTGLYFQWGDVNGYTAEQVGSSSGKKAFGWTDYKYNNDGSDPDESDMSKYNPTDGKITLDLEDDAARVNMGGNWRMPTKSELMSLKDATDYEWVSDYNNTGVAGLLLTSKEDSTKKLFFPASGQCTNGNIRYADSQVFVQSNSIFNKNAISFSGILANNSTYAIMTEIRHNGNVIRAVAD